MILQTKTTKNNEKCPHIPDHPYIILTIGGSGSGKTITYIDKIYLYAKDLSKPKYEFLIKSSRMLEQTILMIQTHLSSVPIQWMTIMRILVTTIQEEKEKF